MTRSHSIPMEPGKRRQPWYVTDTRRRTTSERGYDARWQEASERYRRDNPLCVPCKLRGRVRGVIGGRWSGCVDHIVPVHSCPDLFWEQDNWASMCFSCHGVKTRIEPTVSWQPRSDRIVVCGLPGTGKTTFARASGLPYWDADERPELTEFDAIRAAREAWISDQRGACVVIVASLFTASILAARLRGVVKHMPVQFVDRSRVSKRETPTYVE